jgi:hypothetical protein
MVSESRRSWGSWVGHDSSSLLAHRLKQGAPNEPERDGAVDGG